MDATHLLGSWGAVLLSDFLRYALAAGPAFLVFWVWRPGRIERRRLQHRDPGRGRVLAEIGWSLSTVLIFSGVGLSIVLARAAGWTRIDASPAAAAWGRVLWTAALMILVHDAWFYWTHRLLHWGPLMRGVHRIHHRSTSPTPWAAYAFHPLEALVQAGVFPLLVLSIPAHPRALGLFLLFMILRNVLGHLGFEVLPRGFSRNSFGRWHTTPTHHDLHHQHGSGNYGLYFTFWDEWMGTTRAGYHAAFDAATARSGSHLAVGARRAGPAVLVAALATAAAPIGAAEPGAGVEGLWRARVPQPGVVAPSGPARGARRLGPLPTHPDLASGASYVREAPDSSTASSSASTSPG